MNELLKHSNRLDLTKPVLCCECFNQFYLQDGIEFCPKCNKQINVMGVIKGEPI